MKYRYAFTTGEEAVEISEEWAAVLEEMDREEQLSNRRETRRHQSLDDLLYEGMDFASDGDAESPLLEKEFSAELAEALEKLTETQRRRLLLRCEGMTYEEIGSAERISFQKVAVSIDKAKKNLKNFLEWGVKNGHSRGYTVKGRKLIPDREEVQGSRKEHESHLIL